MSHSTTAGMQQIEEETIQHYEALRYYPVHIGQTFHNRYGVAVKLGFGGNSTVWLCLDQRCIGPKCLTKYALTVRRDNSYKTLKVGICGKTEDKEVEVLNYLKKMRSSHNGRYCVRRPSDSFKIKVPDGYHHCLVYDPLGQSLLEYVKRQKGMILNIDTVRWIATYLLTALDYLHTCEVVHTDIKLDNIQSTLPDEETAILARLVEAERSQPSFRKRVNDTLTIYTSRALDSGDGFNYPILGDLGSTVFKNTYYEGLIQAIPYRAPEVILRMKWTFSVDIWELLFAEHLFGSENEKDSLALMITYLGPPPAEFLERSEVRQVYFDEQGRWKGHTIHPVRLEDRLEGETDLNNFLDFLRCMLQWVPQKRKSAAELLKHSWLKPE
ncbi:MAG: hypothetical protein Q9217_001275 [Psora testacea]